MKHRLFSLAFAALLAGCAVPEGAAPVIPPARPEADEQLVFLDRLSVASGEELRSIGKELRRAVDEDGDATTSLRYALWLATPGHSGHDATAARRRLESLLVEPRALGRPTRALVRMQLRWLRARLELLETNRRLTGENERLREQIRALTELEREMGSDEQ